VLRSKPGDERSAGFGISRPLRYSSMPSLRNSMSAALRLGTVSGENGTPCAGRATEAIGAA
jgi:hypothetical protein